MNNFGNLRVSKRIKYILVHDNNNNYAFFFY